MSLRLLDFYADWCAPCKKQDPIVETVEENWEDNDEIEFEKVDIDDKEELAQQFNVRSIPTIIIVSVSEDDEFDEIHERFVGIAEENELNNAIESALDELE